MFAPRRPKQRIYPTLKWPIETKGNLISQKVGRKIYRVLAPGCLFFIVFSVLRLNYAWNYYHSYLSFAGWAGRLFGKIWLQRGIVRFAKVPDSEGWLVLKKVYTYYFTILFQIYTYILILNTLYTF